MGSQNIEKLMYSAKVLASSNCPDRCFHSSVYDEKRNQIYILFGKDKLSITHNDIWQYDINSGNCTNVTVVGNQSLPYVVRQNAELYQDTIYIFGGIENDDDIARNNMYKYNILTRDFSLVSNGTTTTAIIPPPRYHHASCTDSTNGLMYVIGGVQKINNRFVKLGDVWSFYYSNQSWIKLHENTTYTRNQHHCVHDDVRKNIYCSAGISSTLVNDVWKFNLLNNTWSNIPYTDPTRAFFSRSGHTTFLDSKNGILYVINGYDRMSYSASFLSLNITQNPAQLTDLTSHVFPNPLYARVFHSTVFNSKTGVSYTLGGQNNTDRGYAALSDIFSLSVYRPITTTISVSSLSASLPHKIDMVILICSIVIPLLCLLALLSIYCCRKQEKSSFNFSSDKREASFIRSDHTRFTTARESLLTHRSMDTITAPHNSYSKKQQRSSDMSDSQVRMISAFMGDNSVNVLRIQWNEIYFPSKISELIIGRGSFGVVIRGTWLTTENDQKVCRQVAIKVLSKSFVNEDQTQVEKRFQAAIQEVHIIQTARQRMLCTDNVICVYGIAFGCAPQLVLEEMNISSKMSVIGIVMRYEAGGSLGSLLFESSSDQWLTTGESRTYALTMNQKIHILKSIARGLAELHSVGVIHGDIKPDNVLLSSDTPPQVRLADFGISRVRDTFDLVETSLDSTIHTRGSPIYSAPEMLVNPYLGEINNFKVALPSRRTDMYAFAILAWECIVGTKPYSEYKFNEVTLSMAVHQGVRPSLQNMPAGCPSAVIHMIRMCWDGDRRKRLTATSCYRILADIYTTMTDEYYDVFLSCHPDDMKYVDPLYSRLDSLGLKIVADNDVKLLNDDDDNIDLTNFTIDEPDTYTWGRRDSIDRSPLSTNDRKKPMKAKVVLACISKLYQDSPHCMFHLLSAKNNHPSIPIIPLFLDADHDSWISSEIRYYCQLGAIDMKYYTYPVLLHHNSSSDSNVCTTNAIGASHTIHMDNDNAENGNIEMSLEISSLSRVNIKEVHNDDQIDEDITLEIQESLKELSIAISQHIDELLLQI